MKKVTQWTVGLTLCMSLAACGGLAEDEYVDRDSNIGQGDQEQDQRNNGEGRDDRDDPDQDGRGDEDPDGDPGMPPDPGPDPEECPQVEVSCPDGTAPRYFFDERGCVAEVACEPVGDPNNCEEACIEEFERHLRECDELAQRAPERAQECRREAEASLDACFEQACQPPQPPSCEDVCGEEFERHTQECDELAQRAPERAQECRREAEASLDACFGACDQPPQPEVCQDFCHQEFEEQLRECEERGEDECWQWIEENLDACLRGCDQPEPPGCEQSCEEEFQAQLEECHWLLNEGDDPEAFEECLRGAEDRLGACVERCEVPQPPACQERCERNFEAHLQECEWFLMEGLEEEFHFCIQDAEQSFGACLEGCDMPEPPRCEQSCEEEFQAQLEECHWLLDEGDDPEAFEECLREAEDRLGACVERCEVPQPPACEADCQEEFQRQLEECHWLLNEGDDPEAFEECLREAEGRLGACVERCEVPQPPACEERCERDFEAQQQECEWLLMEGHQEEFHVCVQDLEERLSACLQSCQEPEPPRCEQRCEESFHAHLEECSWWLQDGDEQGYEACLREAEEGLVACLDNCEGDNDGFACGQGQSCRSGEDFCLVYHHGVPGAGPEYACVNEDQAQCQDQEEPCECFARQAGMLGLEDAALECSVDNAGNYTVEIYLP